VETLLSKIAYYPVGTAVKMSNQAEGIIHKYDRKVVETLLSKIAYYPVGTVVKMSNQAEGIVVLQTEDPKCPVVLDFHSGESEKKYNLMLQKDISILQII
jgi:hypothetical protein